MTGFVLQSSRQLSATVSSWTLPYLKLKYDRLSVEPPALNCWGLYRLVVLDRSGYLLDEYSGKTSALAQIRALRDGSGSDDWIPVAKDMDRELDLVLLHGMIGRGYTARFVPFHCGVVVRPGWMMDIEEGNDVLIRSFRDTRFDRGHPTVKHRVIGVFRPKVLT